MNPTELAKKVLEWTALAHFPYDENGRKAIIREVAAMAGTRERAWWIVEQILALTGTWPGLPEVRAIFCLRFKPADGRDTGGSELCPEGQIPADCAVGFRPAQTAIPAAEQGRGATVLPPSVRKLLGGILGDAKGMD